ncbi:MAG: hypothetical protein D6781_10670 [Verrucomicrobia bacterium]|nr:MAG: hypothetical protein D6781_10670 [Verrucomicrobiota bacterium]
MDGSILARPPAHRLGIDLGTTEKKRSNPTALSVLQQVGLSYYARLVLRWKTQDPNVTRAVLRHVITHLPHGLRARRLCVDATNERFFATDLRREFAGTVPVELVIASEKTTYAGEQMTMKQYLGNLLINTIDDGYLALPAEAWLRRDLRQTVRVRGTFEADVDADGAHADATRSLELALHALVTRAGPAEAAAAAVSSLGNPPPRARTIRNPLARQRARRRYTLV